VAAPSGPPPRVTPPRIEGVAAQVTLDGSLDDPAWSGAALLSGFRQYQPVDGRPAEERTEVRIFYAPDALYVGITAFDSQPDAIRTNQADRDNLGSEDRVTLYLDTFNDRRRAYFFTVNALGSQEDGVRSEGAAAPGSFGATDDKNPDFIWQSKGRRTTDGYVVELRIPFKSLRWSPGASLDWGVNVYRYVQRTGYVDVWADTRRGNASTIAQFGTLGDLHDLKRGIVSEAQPVFTSAWSGARDASGFRRGSLVVDPGVNLRLGFTSLTADVAVNPDFSQVESDVGLVTINERFALFFPERRPFFLEGIELFATPNQLVYTRQIGNPVGGAKLTGKLGKQVIAYIGAIDQTGSGDVLANVLRVRRDVGTNSTAGIVYTDRTGAGTSNRVLAGDARWIFGKVYYLEGQLGQSWSGVTNGPGRSGRIWNLTADRTGRAFGFNYTLNGIDEGFETRAGFVPRTGIVEGRISNRFSLYGARGALVEQFTVFGTLASLWRSRDFLRDGAIEDRQSLDASLRLRGGWRPGMNLRRSGFSFDPVQYAGYTVQPGGTPFIVPPRLSNAWVPELQVTTPTWRWGDASVRSSYGVVPIFPEAARGREVRASLVANFRPSSSLRASLSTTVSRLGRVRDGSEFARTILPRAKLEYQPTRALFVRYVGEYLMQRRAALLDPVTGQPLLVNGNASAARETNRFRNDLLVSYEPSPGTVAFFGYGATLDGDRAFDFRGLERSVDGFFVKLSYLIRR